VFAAVRAAIGARTAADTCHHGSWLTDDLNLNLNLNPYSMSRITCIGQVCRLGPVDSNNNMGVHLYHVTMSNTLTITLNLRTTLTINPNTNHSPNPKPNKIIIINTIILLHYV